MPEPANSNSGAEADVGGKHRGRCGVAGRLLVPVLAFLFAFAAASAADILVSGTDGKPALADEKPDLEAWQTPQGKELIAANTQHFYIALPISHCTKDADLALHPPHPTVRAKLLLFLQPDGQYRVWDKPDGTKAPEINLTNFQNAVIYLSATISQARLQTAAVAADSKRWRTWVEWTLVLVGAVTTILISIKSIANERTGVYLTIGILAIIFSALGTAGASLNAFYAPGNSYLRSEKELGQLRLLHSDVAKYVASMSENICASIDLNKSEDVHAKEVKNFSTRLGDIMTSASAGPAQSSTSAVSGTGGVQAK